MYLSLTVSILGRSKFFLWYVVLTVWGLAQPANQPVFNDEKTQLLFNGKVVLSHDRDGYMSLHQIKRSPNGKYFAVIACGFECNENIGFIFKADGTGKKKFTARWDYVLQTALEWSEDGGRIFYYRVDSSGQEPPPNAPKPGWMQVDAETGRKSIVAAGTNRRLKPVTDYKVFNAPDGLVVRAGAGTGEKELGRLPNWTEGVRFTGQVKKIGRSTWVSIQHAGLSGWVNQSYLYEK